MKNNWETDQEFEQVSYPPYPSTSDRPQQGQVGPFRNIELHENIQTKIRDCKSLGDFGFAFEHIRDLLENLERAQIGMNHETWAKDWSTKRAAGDATAVVLDDDRRTVLKFLYKFCDLCYEGSVNPERLIKEHHHQIFRIVSVCLVMDRARALYGLTDTVHNVLGKAWYAKAHTNLMKQVGAIDCDDEHPMNKRFLSLLEWSKVKPESKLPVLLKWIQPALCPLLDYPETVKEAAREAGVLVIEEE